jgi:hypothetical protein
MPIRRNQREPFTALDISNTVSRVSDNLKADISKIVETYVVEFEGVTTEQAKEYVPKFLPVILALIEDGMITGQHFVEKQISEYILLAKNTMMEKNKVIPRSMSN